MSHLVVVVFYSAVDPPSYINTYMIKAMPFYCDLLRLSLYIVYMACFVSLDYLFS